RPRPSRATRAAARAGAADHGACPRRAGGPLAARPGAATVACAARSAWRERRPAEGATPRARAREIARRAPQHLAQRARGEPDPYVERPEERESRARRVEAHLVNELLEDERIVCEQRHAPLPVVEPDGALDDLHHPSGVAASDLSVPPHE